MNWLREGIEPNRNRLRAQAVGEPALTARLGISWSDAM